ncbi:hypothetical protein BGX34_007456 [Mortierella sp. NVP85]|nr:hypothetical protein BGX34_007456 [Mortierella sp. NVP85]
MYLDQFQCSALFSVVRVLLQIASMYFLRNVVSRAYNLTYIERVNAGILSKLRYIFWTKFSNEKSHAFGRIMVLIALVVSAALTWLPTLLNQLYRYEPTYLPQNNKDYTLNYKQLRLTKVEPNHIDISQLLINMSVVSNSSRFYGYKGSLPTMTPCTHSPSNNAAGGTSHHQGILMTCFGDTTVSLGNISDPKVSALDYSNDPMRVPPETPSATNNYTFYPIYVKSGPVNLNMVYATLAPVSSGDFYEDSENGIQSIDNCVAYNGKSRQCVRNTLGYLIIDQKGILVVQKKFVYQGGTGDQDGSDICDQLATPIWQTMCKARDTGTFGKTGFQNLTMTERGARWDIFWGEGTSLGGSYTQVSRDFGALSLEISIMGYMDPARIPDTAEIRQMIKDRQGNKDPTCFWGQELFEATRIYTTSNRQTGSQWVNYGFSPEEITKMTSLILLGSPAYHGSITMTESEILARVPNWVLFLLVGMTIVLAALGYIAGWNVASEMGLPFSEVIPRTVRTTSVSRGYFDKRDVANMTLRKAAPFLEGSSPTHKLPPTIHVDDLQLMVEGDQLRLLSTKERE